MAHIMATVQRLAGLSCLCGLVCELSEMAQRLEDLIAERADERAMIARLDQALADLQALAADKSAPEVKLAIEAAGRLESPPSPGERGSTDPVAQQFIAAMLKLAIARHWGERTFGARSRSGSSSVPGAAQERTLVPVLGRAAGLAAADDLRRALRRAGLRPRAVLRGLSVWFRHGGGP
jgi:hypothetical protein